MEKEVEYQILAGLNVKYDQILVQILGKEEKPSLNKIISIVEEEESRKRVKLETRSTKHFAMITKDSKPHKQAKEASQPETPATDGENRDNL